jgi:hypothetical protein
MFVLIAFVLRNANIISRMWRRRQFLKRRWMLVEKLESVSGVCCCEGEVGGFGDE